MLYSWAELPHECEGEDTQWRVFKDGRRKGCQGRRSIQHRDTRASMGMESHITGTGWDSPGTRAPGHPVPSTRAFLTHPRLHCREGIPGGNDLLSLLWQQAGNKKRNNLWKLIFWLHAPPGCWESNSESSSFFMLCSLTSLPLPSTVPSSLARCPIVKQPPAETCDKPQCGSHSTANGDRGKLYQTGTNL